MQRRGLGGAPGEDEAAERFQLPLGRIDGAFQLRDPVVVDARLGELLTHLVVVRGGQQGTNGEQVALNGDQHFIDARHEVDGAGQADGGVEFVHVAIGFDARVILLDASTAKERGFAGVPGLRIDLHATKASRF
jgi:hypothetical protein